MEACSRYLYIKGKLHDLHVQKVTLFYINRICDPFTQQAVLGEHLNLLIGNAKKKRLLQTLDGSLRDISVPLCMC